MIFESSRPAGAFPDKSVYQLMFEREVDDGKSNAASDEDKPCFINAENPDEQISFAEVKRTILKFGAGLRRTFPDFAKGDVVAVYSPNDVRIIHASGVWL